MLLTVALALISATVLLGCSEKAESESPIADVDPVVTKSLPRDSWVEVRLGDGSAYYGVLGDQSPYLLALESPYYPLSQSSDDSETIRLRAVGDEFHRPERFLIFPVASVASVQALAESSPVVGAANQESPEDVSVPSFESTFALDNAAVFLDDGRLLFGNVSIGEDGWALIEDAYYLSLDEGLPLNQPITSLDDMVLMPQSSQPAAPTGAVHIRLDRVLMIERMSAESPVTEALSQGAQQ